MAERLKDMFFTKESVAALADAIKGSHRGFDKRSFLLSVFDGAFDELERGGVDLTQVEVDALLKHESLPRHHFF